jgi:hypothetical protein
MNIIQQVFDISEVILASSDHVILNYDKIWELADQMKADGVVSFFDLEKSYRVGIHNDVLKELTASSINYCYWYGMHDIRPNGVSSTSLYEDIEDSFKTSMLFDKRIYELIKRLSIGRYPLIEERKRHLLELLNGAEDFTKIICSKEFSGERLFHEMIEMFQGFASDTLLKRASLFFIQLYRKFGWYKDDLMMKLPVPADYQVPKILRHLGCIEYSNSMAEKVDNSILIPKHSLEELQIRASTIKTCEKLQNITGWTIADVDTYLWTKRKDTDTPFHLTITTDY